MSNIKSLKQRVKSTIAVTKVTKVVQLIAAAKLKPARLALQRATSLCQHQLRSLVFIGRKMAAGASNNAAIYNKIQEISKVSTLLLSKAIPTEMAQTISICQQEGGNKPTGITSLQSIEEGTQFQMAGLGGGCGQKAENRTENKRIMIVAIGTERGLCGSLNAGVAKFIRNKIKDIQAQSGYSADAVEIKVLCGGKKIHNLIKDLNASNIQIEQETTWYADKISKERTEAVSAKILNEAIKYQPSDCILVFQNFITTLNQEVESIEIFSTIASAIKASEEGLPQPIMASIKKQEGQLSTQLHSGANLIIEGDIAEALSLATKKFYNSLVSYALASNFAAENAMRMTSMDSATKNGEKLAHQLELKANKLRQGKITNDLIDLMGGTSVVTQ